MKINSISIGEGEYLAPLKELAFPPKHLYYCGSLPPDRILSVAIVGTRRPTPYGKEVTYDFAYKLAQRGIVVISGLAFGIDAAAHRGALDAGGITIAVLANGLDSIYPAAHQRLAEEIVQKDGALISEYPVGTSAMKHHFLHRNRLVSGLADAVIVTEAGARSGTLSTVNHALDQNREVFAVPGPINSLLSVGPNRLLTQGAHPALSVDSILEIIAPVNLATKTSFNLRADPIEKIIDQLLKDE